MNDDNQQRHLRAVATQVREACVATARAAYFDAAASGLCGEGALEAAIGAMQALDLEALLGDPRQSAP